MAIKVGTSGWSYPSWRPGFYPEGLQPVEFLGFYARRFETVELNSTGYRLPSADQFRRWADAVPNGFEFSVKLPLVRLDRVTSFLERVLALGDRLGPVRIVYEGPRDDGTLSFVQGWIDTCRAAGKPYIVYEYGWDVTNFPSRPSLSGFLGTLRADSAIAGDAFWALEAHADGHGWKPVPADTTDPQVARTGESGQWWAMYYTGVRTMVMSAVDMAARAQIVRRHNYAMAGTGTPQHAIPPAPTITSIIGGRVYWRGSAGAGNYSIQRAPAVRGPWTTVCRRCVTDSSDGFLDRRPLRTGWYRVIPNNLDGRPGPASKPRRATAS